MKERDDKKRKESEHEKVQVKEIFNELEALKQQVIEFENNYKRALADYQNLQKRVQEEKSEWIKTANGNLIVELLPALDHLDTALKGAEESGQHSPWLKGVEMTASEFRRVLEEQGLEPVQVEKFDPRIHEVIEARESPEVIILDVFHISYTPNSRLT